MTLADAERQWRTLPASVRFTVWRFQSAEGVVRRRVCLLLVDGGKILTGDWVALW